MATSGDAFEPVGLNVGRDHCSRVLHALGNVCRLRSRGGTQIEHRFARLRIEQIDRTHGRLVLDSEVPPLQPLEGIDPDAAIEPNRFGQCAG